MFGSIFRLVRNWQEEQEDRRGQSRQDGGINSILTPLAVFTTVLGIQTANLLLLGNDYFVDS